MANSVQIKATYGGRSLAVLNDLVSARANELKETTASAAIATIINILKSLRSLTKKVNVAKASGFVTCTKSANYVAGWRTRSAVSGGGGVSHFSSRCVRMPGKNGGIVVWNPINLAGKYVKGEKVDVYVATDVHGEGAGARQETYWIIARSEEQARGYVVNRRRKRIEKHQGLAKFILSRAIYETSRSGILNTGSTTSAVSRISAKNLIVKKHTDGFSSGRSYVYVNDNLNYAVPALRGGITSLDIACKRAANFTAGLITRKTIDFGKRYETPFPDVKQKR